MGCQTKEWTEKSNKNIYFFHTICVTKNRKRVYGDCSNMYK